MQLIRVLGMVLITILTSFYFFPFKFTFLPVINTKNIMAGIGLCLWGIQLAYKQGAKINRDFLQLTLWAGAVSLLCFLAVVINDTNDYTYVTYVLSMWIWVSAANLVVSLIKKLHKQASVELVVNYLAVVCVAQCLIALAFDLMPHFRYWVSWFYNIGTRQERLEGIV